MAKKLALKKLGNARKHRMSELERSFLSQQPILQQYFNARAAQLAEKYNAEGNACRVKIAVVPTFNEKIYNIVTEVIPAEAKTEADIFRVTRYIRFKEWMDAQTTIALEQEKPIEEQNLNTLQALLPDNLAHQFVNVTRKEEDGSVTEVQLRQESSFALKWIDERLKALTEEFGRIGEAEHTRLTLGQKQAVPTFIRLHHDAEVGPKVVALRRRGPVGVGKTEVIREVGDLLSYGIEKDEDRFENRNVYEQAEIKRFIQPLFDNAFPWTIIDLGLK